MDVDIDIDLDAPEPLSIVCLVMGLTGLAMACGLFCWLKGDTN